MRQRQIGLALAILLALVGLGPHFVGRNSAPGWASAGAAEARPPHGTDDPAETYTAETSAPGRYALLVGCTRYPHAPAVHELYGPRNDVHTFADLLVTRFGFAPEHIEKLIGGAEDPSSEPTSTNIAAAFDRLVAQAQPGDQFFVLLSGHGVQVPIPAAQQDAMAPSNPEPDGLDEVFLPSDFAGWKDDQLVGALKDDQIGGWLRDISDRGAHVWVVFDCCHSGTMSRSLSDGEIDRGVQPIDIGVPHEALEQAALKAQAAAGGERQRSVGGEPPLEVTAAASSGPAAQGSITAFYAAQAFETAPELPRPPHAPRTPEHYHGLLSYVLAQVLSQASGPLTYRELSHAVVTQYRADRGSRSPTPFFDGDLSRAVLSAVQRKAPEIVLQRDAGVLTVNTGQLMGVSENAVLACYDPAGDDSESAPLGYVRITHATPTSSEVEPCAFGEREAIAADALPNLARCRIVAKEIGEMHIPVALRPSLRPDTAAGNAMLKRAIDHLRGEQPWLVQVCEREIEADWLLQIMDPEEAREQLGLNLESSMVFLRQSPRLAAKVEPNQVAGTARHWRVYGQYAADDPQQLAAELERDLRKIYTWHNVWRIAGTLDQPVNAALQLDVKRLGTTGADEDHIITQLQPGERIEVKLTNEGIDDMTVTLLFLDANFGISRWYTAGLRAGESLRPLRVRITAESAGTEGIVVMAQRLGDKAIAPDYDILVQEPLGVNNRGNQSFPAATTAFGKLLQTAATGKGMKAAMLEADDTPEVIAKSWLTLPAAQNE